MTYENWEEYKKKSKRTDIVAIIIILLIMAYAVLCEVLVFYGRVCYSFFSNRFVHLHYIFPM